MPRRPQRRRPTPVLQASLPLLTSILHAYQAGGGGSFGGGGGGGGGGDGDGVFFLFYFLIRLAVEVPIVGVPVLILVVFVFITGSRKGWFRHQERTIRRARPALVRNRSAARAAQLMTGDPGFDAARFLTRVERAFGIAQRSWCSQDLDLLRPFVTDGVHERFSLQIEEQREDGWRQELEDLRTGELSIQHLEEGLHFDTLSVRIPFHARIHRLAIETGERISGATLARTDFVECWSFVRRRGAKTMAKQGLIEGYCPNCGAPLEMNQSANCASCGCLALSGEFDWVLAEITQASEWRTQSEAAIPGFAAYVECDPGLSIQLLEDRASVAFWRKCAADRMGDPAPLARLSEATFPERYAATLGPGGQRARTYMGDCAVGSVRTLGLIDGDEHDRAIVEVVWDGRRARLTTGGERELERERRLHKSLFIFRRASGAQTHTSEAFTSAHCHTCGAPDPGGTAPLCPYCEAPRSGDASTWLLHDILAPGSPKALNLTSELRDLGRRRPPAANAPTSQLSASGLFRWASALVIADGKVDATEREALESLAAKHGLPADRVQDFLGTATSESGVPAPRDTLEARSWLRALVELALADGSLDKNEERFLRHAAQRLGVSQGELATLRRSTRKELYRDSRRSRRGDRRR